MTEQSLICNYRKCKVPITDFACVTSCLHVFCRSHLIQGEGAERRCYTCNTVLEGGFDVQHKNINLTEDIKSNKLTGYTCDVIFDIMARGIRFWEYQTNSKMMLYKLEVEHLKSRLADRSCALDNMVLNIKHYINKQEEKVKHLEREVETLSTYVKDLEKQLKAKNHQLSNMQTKLQNLHRNSIASMITQDTEHMELEEMEFVGSQQPVASNKVKSPVFVFNPITKATPSGSSVSSKVNSPVPNGSNWF